MNVDEKIRELEGLLERARAVKEAYPDAYVGRLPNGEEAWVSRSVKPTTVCSITEDGRGPMHVCVCAKVGDVAVFEANDVGQIRAARSASVHGCKNVDQVVAALRRAT